MTKQKKSFFEKLTGIQRIDDESEIEINSFPEPEKKELEKEDSYEFSDKEDPEEDEKEDKKTLSVKPDNEIKEEEEGDDLIAPITPAEPKKKDEDEPEVDAEGQLTIDVYQTDRDIVIKSTIAGVKPEDLDVDINSEMVTVKGKRSQDEEIDSENYYYQECYWGPFSRSIILPVEIVTEKAEATMKNGILTIKLPKMEVAKSRKLQVRGF